MTREPTYFKIVVPEGLTKEEQKDLFEYLNKSVDAYMLALEALINKTFYKRLTKGIR